RSQSRPTTRSTAEPVEVFTERCFIGSESDETMVYRLWDVFQDVAIWSSDYPHHDAEDAWDALHHMTELDVPAKAQQKLLGENARRLYGIDPVTTVDERIEKYDPAILPWDALRRRALQRGHGAKDVVRVGPDLKISRDRKPADDAVAIQHDRRRARNVLAVRSGARVHEAIAPGHREVAVGEKAIAEMQ